MIPPAIDDEVRQAADIVEIISDYLTLQPSGRNYKALSPFTMEKTPSFVVSPDKQIYKCFSTGKGGNAVSEVDGRGRSRFILVAEIPSTLRLFPVV